MLDVANRDGRLSPGSFATVSWPLGPTLNKKVSDLLSEEGARDLLELVPHAEYVDVEGAGHMVAGDKNDLFNDAIVGFLDRLRPA